MRPAQKSNRARGRGNRKNGGGGGGGNNVNRVYESAGPEGKVRGTPQQIVDKYLSLARDAQTSGDRVTAENFLQHAEHYQRLLLTAMGAQESRRESQPEDDDDDAQTEGARANGHAAADGEAASGDEAEAAEGAAESNGHAAQPGQTAGQGNGQSRRNRRGRGSRQSGEQAEAGDAADESNGTASEAAAAPTGNGAAPDAAPIAGFDTIDTEPPRGPDLLVETEDIAKSQPRRRRPRREEGAEAEAGDDAPEAPLAGESSEA